MESKEKAAVFVKDMSVQFKGTAHLFRLSEPMLGEYGSYDYVVASTAHMPFSGPETMIFPSDEEGTVRSMLSPPPDPEGKDDVKDWLEYSESNPVDGALPASVRGTMDISRALANAGYSVAYPPDERIAMQNATADDSPEDIRDGLARVDRALGLSWVKIRQTPLMSPDGKSVVSEAGKWCYSDGRDPEPSVLRGVLLHAESARVHVTGDEGALDCFSIDGRYPQTAKHARSCAECPVGPVVFGSRAKCREQIRLLVMDAGQEMDMSSLPGAAFLPKMYLPSAFPKPYVYTVGMTDKARADAFLDHLMDRHSSGDSLAYELGDYMISIGIQKETGEGGRVRYAPVFPSADEVDAFLDGDDSVETLQPTPEEMVCMTSLHFQKLVESFFTGALHPDI